MNLVQQNKIELSKQKLHNCVVCLNNINKIFYKTPCEHYFHKKCILPWIKVHNSCPICRKSIDKSKPIIFCEANNINDDYEYALQLQNEINLNEFNLNEFNLNEMINFININNPRTRRRRTERPSSRFCFRCDSDICICNN